jgi:ABC-type multidrug transport system fused ATPase/permease subunit
MIKKLNFLIPADFKKKLFVLIGLLFIGTIFEMLGLGAMIPALGIMLNPNIGDRYPRVQPILKLLGNPSQLELIIWGMTALVLIYLFKTIYLFYLNWKQSKFSGELASTLSQKLFYGYLTQPYSFHLNRNSSELLSNIQNEIFQFNVVSQAAINLFLELSVMFGMAFTLILVEPIGAIFVSLFLFLFVIIFHSLTKTKLEKLGNGRQVHSEHVNKHLLQGFGGVKEIKLMGREKYFSNAFSEHNRQYNSIIVKVNTLTLAPRLYLEFLAVCSLIGLLLLMVIQGKSIEHILPTLGIFLAAAFRMIPSVNKIVVSTQHIRYAKPVISILYNEFKLIENTLDIKHNNIDKFQFKSNIYLEDISLKYTGSLKNALDGVSITINKFQTIGFIGTSGSGKSTMVDVILGIIYPNEGKVYVDGVDISTNFAGWQSQIGYVPQTIYLTDDSLRKNIAFGIPENEIDEDAIIQSLKAAQLENFVNELPEKIETLVGERGVRLSGGQRQRIGIARALYRDPDILVLDEATSALDSTTEKEVMNAVNALRGRKTIIIVAHRLSTLENCDRIYQLENGKITKEGNPNSILHNS